MKWFASHAPMLLLLCFLLQFSEAATDRILQGQSISTSQTIVSAGETFELGFFCPGISTKFYVGLWYKKNPTQTVVWVANRDYAATSSAVLTINSEGNLIISDNQFFYMVSNTSSEGNTTATLLDSGNLELRDQNSVLLWQSFDHPSDTFLPGMKLGINKKTGQSWSLASWRSADDPATGKFSLKMDHRGQFIIMQGSLQYWTSGPWNGRTFSFLPEMRPTYIFNFSFSSNDDESYFTFSLYNNATISRLVMDLSGQIKQLTWFESVQEWNIFWAQPKYQCDVYSFCGTFGVCDPKNLPFCSCLKGFEPRSSQDWGQQVFTSGCVRKVPLQCEDPIANNGEKSKFMKLLNMRSPAGYPQTLVIWGAKECKLTCLRNCSCSAYTYNGSGGCSLWSGDLLNLLQQVKPDGGETIFVKLDASEFPDLGGRKKVLLVMIIALVFSALLCLGCFSFCHRRWKRRLKGKMGKYQNILLFDPGVSIVRSKVESSERNTNTMSSGKNKDSELPLFSFSSVSAATDNFSSENKLGEGGFGPVYKGKLFNGHEIAVKRLSKRSGQGLEELKNEAMLIAKLQHRNLVRLLGCCLERDEKILIYEYMPNKSLDSFLFDPTKKGLLNWAIRVGVINGIAQGLLYLHQYSRLRIIHRDLKASNILLDQDMNPKISDFGMARIFGGNESQANTNRIVGTYGYMSPEYALEGLFSMKSDVFSFGVLLLEILSGRKNTGFYQSDSLNLLGYVWDLWKADKATDMMDPILEDQSSKEMLLRYINVALLCVQEIAADRPTMSEVVSMLTNELASRPSPKQPGFSFVRNTIPNSRTSVPKFGSINGVTVSVLEAR